MKPLFKVLAIVLLTAGSAFGQAAGVIVIDKTLRDHEYTFLRETWTKTQRVLTASDPKRKHLRGLSYYESELLVNSSVTDKFVTNDVSTDFMQVSNLRMDGGRTVNQSTSVSNISDGVQLVGQYCTIDNCLFENFAGAGIVLNAFQIARNNLITGCIDGIEVVNSDCVIANNESINTCQNACIHITAAGGHVDVQNNHCFGAVYALKNFGGDFVTSSDNMYADSHFGVWEGAGDQSKYTADFFQHNRTRDIYVGVTSVEFNGCTVNVQHKVDQSGYAPDVVTGKIGVEFLAAADRCRFIGGEIVLANYSRTDIHSNPVAADAAIQVAGDDCTFKTYLIDADFKSGAGGSIGLKTVGAIKGGVFEFTVGGGRDTNMDGTPDADGFLEANDRLLVIGNVGLRSCTFVFRGANIDTTNPGKYVDVGADWKPANSGNSIKLINTTTGAEVELENQAY